jgi:hypothetical protein
VLTGSGLGQQNASTRHCCSPIRANTASRRCVCPLPHTFLQELTPRLSLSDRASHAAKHSDHPVPCLSVGNTTSKHHGTGSERVAQPLPPHKTPAMQLSSGDKCFDRCLVASSGSADRPQPGIDHQNGGVRTVLVELSSIRMTIIHQFDSPICAKRHVGAMTRDRCGPGGHPSRHSEASTRVVPAARPPSEHERRRSTAPWQDRQDAA